MSIHSIMKAFIRTLRFVALGALGAASLALLAASVLGCLGPNGYLIDQCSQLRIVFLIAFIVLLFPLLFLRSQVGTVISLVGFGLNLIVIIPLYWPGTIVADTPIASSEDELKLVTINLWGARNRRYKDVVSYVKKTDADLLCLNEVSKPWLQQLNKDLPEYKYKFDEGISGGAAIYSKVPIEQAFPANLSQGRRYGVRGIIQVNGKQIMVVAEHPPSPSERKRWKSRNAEFDKLAVDADECKTPFVLIGDLNTTPWSPYFQMLLKRGRLHDSELGFGVQSSWSTHLLLVPPVVPIDHCLTSNHFQVLDRELGPNVGSDHLPVYVKLRLIEQSRTGS